MGLSFPGMDNTAWSSDVLSLKCPWDAQVEMSVAGGHVSLKFKRENEAGDRNLGVMSM